MAASGRAATPTLEVAARVLVVGAATYATVSFLVEAFLCLRAWQVLTLGQGAALLVVPMLALVAAAVSTFLFFSPGSRPPMRASGVAGAVGVLAREVILRPFGWFRGLLPLIVCGLVAIPITEILLRRRRSANRAISSEAALSSGIIVLTILAGFARLPTPAFSWNRYSLISAEPDSIKKVDYGSDSRKDNYPPCVYRYNSLGYRDVEPPSPATDGRRRVLLVGDSYIWGDGIPTDDETLGALLRRHFEAVAPGRFEVMVAASPGIGVYGYRRAVEELEPIFHPSVIVVSFLGINDFKFMDSQFLIDLVPKRWPFSSVVLNVNALEAMHLWAVAHPVAADIDHLPPNLHAFFDVLSSFAREGKGRSILINYPGESYPGLPPGIETLELPAAWLYPGRSNDLWYSKDWHPKPKLNRLLAGLLGDTIASPTGQGH